MEIFWFNYPYIFAILLFSLGWLIIFTQANLIKKVIGINIMESGIFLFFLAIGDIADGQPPIFEPGVEGIVYVNPLPSALILTGIVVSFSITALALSIIIKIYSSYNTIYMPQLLQVWGDQ